MLHGFTKVTIDEISTLLGISKKTVYHYFPSKEELVERIVEMTLSEIRDGLDRIVTDEESPFPDKLQRLFHFLGHRLPALISKPFLNDLQKKLPHLWNRIDQFRKELLLARFDTFIQEGIDQGVIRRDLNKQLFTLIYINTVQNIFRPDVLMNIPLTLNEVADGIIKTFFIGILTDDVRSNFQEAQI